MSKKDYVLLAKELRITWQQCTGHDEKQGFVLAVSCLCDALQRENSKFDRDRFLLAVSMGEYVDCAR